MALPTAEREPNQPRGAQGGGGRLRTSTPIVQLCPRIPSSILISHPATPEPWHCRGEVCVEHRLATNRPHLNPNFPSPSLCSLGEVAVPLWASLALSAELKYNCLPREHEDE